MGVDIFYVFGRFYLRERILDPVSVTRIAFKDKIMGFQKKNFSINNFSYYSVLSMFIHDISLKHNPETTATNLFQASLLRRVVVELHFSL